MKGRVANCPERSYESTSDLHRHPTFRASSLLSTCIYARPNAAVYHSLTIPDEHDRRKLHRRTCKGATRRSSPKTSLRRLVEQQASAIRIYARPIPRPRPSCLTPRTAPQNPALRQPGRCLLSHGGRRPLDGTGCSDEPERGNPCGARLKRVPLVGRVAEDIATQPSGRYAPAIPVPTLAPASFGPPAIASNPRTANTHFSHASVLHGMHWYAVKLRDVDAANSSLAGGT
ncbi:hypothetical protein MKEN_00956200 [Mycena kentingensis (nom. inval.)]|nr:hypothetical protein MKEN_00956200 [Mycena kentingensis (nom. inval.)]